MGLIGHLESRLGRMVEGWGNDPDSQPMPFQIAHFSDGSLPDVETYGTVGLSDYGLSSRKSGRTLRQELILAVHSAVAEGPYPAILQQIAMEILNGNSPILRGDVIGPYGSILPKSKMEAFYAAIPVHYDDDFAGVDLESGERAAIVWVVPIGRREAHFVATEGWDVFEEKLVESNPDLLDPFRDEIPL